MSNILGGPMKTIHVHARKPYDVFIESGLLSKMADHLASIKKPCPMVIVTDDQVGKHYLHQVSASLSHAGFTVYHYVFSNGEASKNAEELIKIVEFCAEKHLTRSDLILALGGGVVGDMAGFAAATYLRGIDYVQVPTSLLAAVDSSVGGKTAVNLSAGKNLWGAFKQPIAVYCDPDTLQTLPHKEFINGCGEIIKYGMLDNPELLELLEATPLTQYPEAVKDIISACVQSKARIVAQDELEGSVRQLLNFGHTFAHGIEKVSQFKVHHGYAVAIGMALMTQGAVKVDGLDPKVADRFCKIIEAHDLPIDTDYDKEAILEAAKNDKKSHGSTINIIVPSSWGHSVIKEVSHEELRKYLI